MFNDTYQGQTYSYKEGYVPNLPEGYKIISANMITCTETTYTAQFLFPVIIRTDDMIGGMIYNKDARELTCGFNIRLIASKK